MADNIIRIKNPIRIRESDDKETSVRKQNENNRVIWQTLNDILDRLSAQEDRSLLEYIKENKNSITIKTARTNREIPLI